jgi:hypothetical protein
MENPTISYFFREHHIFFVKKQILCCNELALLLKAIWIKFIITNFQAKYTKVKDAQDAYNAD